MPSETNLVGDAKNDVVMDQNAYDLPIVVLTGYLNKIKAEKLGVKYIIYNVTNLNSKLQLL
jgi:phosphoglycolate phosphatase-like HAD superfamily hydrolase